MHIEKAVVSYNSFFLLERKTPPWFVGHTSPKKKSWSHKKLTWQMNENPDTIGQH